jgi:hypothetical protein
LGPDAFAATQRNAVSGRGNVEPRRTYGRKPDVELSQKAHQWLTERFQLAAAEHGLLRPAVLAKLTARSGLAPSTTRSDQTTPAAPVSPAAKPPPPPPTRFTDVEVPPAAPPKAPAPNPPPAAPLESVPIPPHPVPAAGFAAQPPCAVLRVSVLFWTTTVPWLKIAPPMPAPPPLASPPLA